MNEQAVEFELQGRVVRCRLPFRGFDGDHDVPEQTFGNGRFRCPSSFDGVYPERIEGLRMTRSGSHDSNGKLSTSVAASRPR